MCVGGGGGGGGYRSSLLLFLVAAVSTAPVIRRRLICWLEGLQGSEAAPACQHIQPLFISHDQRVSVGSTIVVLLLQFTPPW